MEFGVGIFHLFFFINFGAVELLQDDLATGCLADKICMTVELLQDDPLNRSIGPKNTN